VGFLSLREAWCDTTSPAGKLMLTIFGGIAEFERDLIHSGVGRGFYPFDVPSVFDDFPKTSDTIWGSLFTL
jgi:hypothetical protein